MAAPRRREKAREIPARSLPLAALLTAAVIVWATLTAPTLAAAPKSPARPAAVEWEFNKIGLGNALYPALLLGVSTLNLTGKPDPRQLGDPNGVISVEVVAPRDKARVAVEISSTLLGPSRFEGVLPWRNVRFTVAPFLKGLERLVLVRQPYAEVFTARLWVDGVFQGEKSARVVVRSINDCIYRFEEDGERLDATWLFASYANENHPAVESLLREALALGEVKAFEGYAGDADSVLREVRAIWSAVEKRELAYSNLVRASAGVPEGVLCQHVRLLGEVLENRQANCVEASCLLASVFYKLALEPFLVLIPGHMFVGVFLEPGFKNPLFLETTALSGAGFDKAVEAGSIQAEKASLSVGPEGDATAWDTSDPDGPRIISIGGVREAGVMPIREPEADRTRFLLLK